MVGLTDIIASLTSIVVGILVLYAFDKLSQKKK